jgi:hypothetical protein
MGVFLGYILTIEYDFKLLTLSIKTKVQLVHDQRGAAYLRVRQQVLVNVEAR